MNETSRFDENSFQDSPVLTYAHESVFFDVYCLFVKKSLTTYDKKAWTKQASIFYNAFAPSTIWLTDVNRLVMNSHGQ